MKNNKFLFAALLMLSAQYITQAQTSSSYPNSVPVAGTVNSAFGKNALNTAAAGSMANTGCGYNACAGVAAYGTSNTGIGVNALQQNAGNANTAAGYNALQAYGNFGGCTGIGAFALNANTGNNITAVGFECLLYSSGQPNEAIGYQAMRSNTAGAYNVAIGGMALAYNTTGSYNTAAGYGCLGHSGIGTGTLGSNNTGCGYHAMWGNTKGNTSTAFGYEAMKTYSSVTGRNVAVGYQAMYTNDGFDNTAIGYKALQANAYGVQATALGYQALMYNTPNYGTGIGYGALRGLPGGADNHPSTAAGYLALNSYSGDDMGNPNTACGARALQVVQAINCGDNIYDCAGMNTGMGYRALATETGGSMHAALGYQALNNQNSINTEQANTAVGSGAGQTYSAYNACTFLGTGADGNGSYQNSTAIGRFATFTQSNMIQVGDASILVIDGYPAYVNISDGRFKTNIKNEVKGLQFIQKLRPVTYNFDTRKLDEFQLKNMPEEGRKERLANTDYQPSTAVRRTGFIAQEVEKAASEAGYNFNGIHKPVNNNQSYSLAYELFVAPLVMGMQEQQQIIEGQEKPLAALATRISELKASIKDIDKCCKTALTGINENKTYSNKPQLLDATPNPATGYTVISSFIPNTAGSARIQLTDVKGAILQSIKLEGQGVLSTKVQTLDLPAAVYYYSLIIDDRLIATKKLGIINK